MTKSIIKAVEKGELGRTCIGQADSIADVRAIVAKGWSSRGGDLAKKGGSDEFPDSCFGLEKVPHGWLFPKGMTIYLDKHS
jgi:sterol 3beta-glucosyltransferase